MNAPSHPIRCSQTWLTATSPRWKPHFSLLVRLPSICSRVVSLKQAWSSFPTSTFRLFFLSIVNKIFYIPRWTFEMPCARTFIIDGSYKMMAALSWPEKSSIPFNFQSFFHFLTSYYLPPQLAAWPLLWPSGTTALFCQLIHFPYGLLYMCICIYLLIYVDIECAYV